MIIDAHCHLEPAMEPIPHLIAQMERHGIDKLALIAPIVEPLPKGEMAGRISGVVRRALRSRWPAVGRRLYRATALRRELLVALGRSRPVEPRPDNDGVGAAIEAHPDRFLGWVFVNPAVADPLHVLERLGDRPGWIGVKAHPFWHGYPVAALDGVARWCSERRKPLLVHLGGDGLRGDYCHLPDRFPRLPVVYAHGGLPFYRELWDHLRGTDGVYVDLSSPHLDEPLRRATVQAMGPRRCLYGSDAPYGYPDADGRYDHGAILAEIDRLPLCSRDKDRIFGENFAELIGAAGE